MKGVKISVLGDEGIEKQCDRLRIIINRIISSGRVENYDGRPIVSQKELAEAIGYSQTGLSMAASGTRAVSKGLAQRLHGVYPFFSVEWLRTGKGKMIEQPVDNGAPAQLSPEEMYDMETDQIYDILEDIKTMTFAHEAARKARAAARQEHNEEEEDKYYFTARRISDMTYGQYKKVLTLTSEFQPEGRRHIINSKGKAIMEKAKEEFGYL